MENINKTLDKFAAGDGEVNKRSLKSLFKDELDNDIKSFKLLDGNKFSDAMISLIPKL